MGTVYRRGGSGGAGTDAQIYKGAITADFDSSTIAGLDTGWTYTINNPAGVTDSNTGQSFQNKDEITWNGTDWTIVGQDDDQPFAVAAAIALG